MAASKEFASGQKERGSLNILFRRKVPLFPRPFYGRVNLAEVLAEKISKMF
jgi:hypothetical protein